MSQMRQSAERGRSKPAPAHLAASSLGMKLGVPAAGSEEIVPLVEKGLPTAALKALVRGGLSDAEVYEIIVPRRTLAHRIANRQPLSRDESDKAVRVARIAAMAERAFGERERSWRWLRKPKARFGGKAPMDMLATEAGGRLVEEAIMQIDYGMLA